jgi:chemotaxis protein methyltransferase CheR
MKDMTVLATNRPPNPDEYEFVCQLVFKHSQINLANEKKEVIARRLQDRLQITGLRGYNEYCVFLESSAGEEELSDLLEGLAENTVTFFREEAHFKFLAETVLPGWVADQSRRPGDLFRAWSAACSSGEEAYSIALVLADFFSRRPEFRASIMASDVSARLIHRAREAIYRAGQLKLPDPDWRRRYFLPGVGAYHGCWRVKKEIKQTVTFHQASLFDPQRPFVKKMDVIFCHNILCFNRETQDVLTSRFLKQLAPGGYLFARDSDFSRNLNDAARTASMRVT